MITAPLFWILFSTSSRMCDRHKLGLCQGISASSLKDYIASKTNEATKDPAPAWPHLHLYILGTPKILPSHHHPRWCFVSDQLMLPDQVSHSLRTSFYEPLLIRITTKISRWASTPMKDWYQSFDSALRSRTTLVTTSGQLLVEVTAAVMCHVLWSISIRCHCHWLMGDKRAVKSYPR